MSMFTPAEQAAYSAMQARLIALLVRHDEQSFGHYYDQREQFEQERDTDALQRYRELGVLFHLRDELFEHILPRIVRRLSFESPRNMLIEEPPVRGRIDWERTLDATWAERPGETPLLLHTRQRRRDFATPENLLTVATLLEYRDDVQQLLRSDQAIVGSEAFRHPLNEIVERCDRELAFPQFAGLRQEAHRILEGSGTELLEVQVQDRLLPGSNSAYEELLQWRQRRRALRLLRRDPLAESNNVLGADPARDNYLYQLWIFFELVDLLHEDRRLDLVDTRPGMMRLQFRWGNGSEERGYELQHDQELKAQVAHWRSTKQKGGVPGVRPDFYLQRIDPPLEQIPYNDGFVWHEGGVVWDAKYYRESERDDAPSSPVKRMIADLTLLGESYGSLLFAFLKQPEQFLDGDSQNHSDGSESVGVDAYEYQLSPERGRDQTITPAQTVTIHQLRPASDISMKHVRKVLRKLLDTAHARLHEPRVPRCVGVFLDTLSAAGRSVLLDRYGQALDDDPAELLICPKPHIGPWRVDIVSRQRHCLQDPWLCQIIHRPGSTKPIRPPRTAEDLLKELQQIFSKDDVDDETVSAIAQQVESITRRFAEIAGVYRRIEVYYNRLRDLGMEQTLDRLGPAERESLALAIFLVEQLDSIGAHDFSAPAIHLSSVMEIEVKRRIFTCPYLNGDLAKPKKQTLGVLPYIKRFPENSDGNWDAIKAFVTQHWHEQIDPEDMERVISFDDFVAKALSRISQLRNTAAHTEPLSRKEYSDLQRMTCQGGPLGYGALNVLLLAWQEQHIDMPSRSNVGRDVDAHIGMERDKPM